MFEKGSTEDRIVLAGLIANAIIWSYVIIQLFKMVS